MLNLLSAVACVNYRPLPDGFIFAVIGLFAAVFGGGLLLSWWKGWLG